MRRPTSYVWKAAAVFHPGVEAQRLFGFVKPRVVRILNGEAKAVIRGFKTMGTREGVCFTVMKIIVWCIRAPTIMILPLGKNHYLRKRKLTSRSTLDTRRNRSLADDSVCAGFCRATGRFAYAGCSQSGNGLKYEYTRNDGKQLAMVFFLGTGER